MVVENFILHAVLEKFPDLDQEIKSLFSQCEEFREICEDYVLCLNSIKKIESEDVKKDEYLIEFKTALEELELELLSNLKIQKINNKIG